MDENQRFLKIKEDIASLSDQKIRIEERYKNEKEKLEKILKEISEKGYDPQKLSDIKNKKQEELQTALEELEESIQNITQKLKNIEV